MALRGTALSGTALRRTALIAILLAPFACLGAWVGAQGQGREPSASVRPPPPGPAMHGASQLILPVQPPAVRAAHDHPAHRALRCVRCHVRAGTSTNSRDSLRPPETACAECHAESIDRAQAHTSERCGLCHAGYVPPPAELIPAPAAALPRLRFSHRAHVQRAMRCLSCHAGADRDDGRHLPTMRECFTCHAPPGLGPSAAAPSTCDTCHLADPDGVLRTRFADGWMNPPAWMSDMRHDAEWIVRHRWIGADRGSLCQSCHRESDCTDCHDGRVRPRGVHPGDFLSTHVSHARRDQPRCASCHTYARFCLECHSRLGLAPISAPDVRGLRRYHPAPEAWTRGPNLHAIEARRSLSSCVSCHAESDCVVCHGSRGLGGAGLSPHPPGFANGCATPLAQNARACVTCHGDLEALRARCR